MATILDKDLVRESTVKINDREVQVTLGSDQTIRFKLKGMKTGEVSITIDELYRQLAGIKSEPVSGEKKGSVSVKHSDSDAGGGPSKYTGAIDLSSYKGDGRYVISIHDLRHYINVKPLDVNVKHQIEGFLVDLINERKPVKA
jgi:hypothetical protein